ncbi:MAG: S41 family peptidase [Planctomycetota bacterium]
MLTARLPLAIALVAICTFVLPPASLPARDPGEGSARPSDPRVQGVAGLRQPAISPDGTEIAFSYRGDIWIAPVAGGEAKQVTATPACEEQPAWHPGAHGLVLAFTSDEMGTQDIVLGLRTGAKRLLLTHHGADDCAPAFSHDGKYIYFQSRRDSNLDLCYNESLWDVWRVPTAGGTARRITHFRGQHPAASADDSRIAFSRYGSGYADGEHDLFIVGKDGGVPRSVVCGRPDQRYPKFAARNLFFISNANGVNHNTPIDNIWGCQTDGGAQFQVTNFRAGAITGWDLSPDGTFAIIERDYRLYGVDIASGNVTPIAITIPGDPYAKAANATVDSRISGGVSELVVLDAGTGERGPDVAFCIGDCMRHAQLPLDEDARLKIPELDTPIGRSPQWPDLSRDGWLAVCEGDGNGNQTGSRVVLHDIGGKRDSRTVAEGGNYRCLTWSPDGTKLAVTETDDKGGQIVEIDIATDESTVLVPHPAGNAIPLYAQYMPANRLMYVVSTPGNGGYTSQVMLLNREAGTTVQLPMEYTGLIRHLQVSPDGLKLAFTVPAGGGGGFRGGDRIMVYEVLAQKGRQLDSRVSCAYPRWLDNSRLVAASSTSADQGVTVYTLGDGSDGDDGKDTAVLHRFDRNQPIKRSELQVRTFDAMLGLFARQFYDPFTHGIDWTARGNLYRPIAAETMTTRELYDMMSRLILELDSSHVHVELPPTSGPRTGMPAWEVEQLATGALKVLDVLPNGPAANAGIKVGDVITAVNGKPLAPNSNLDQLLSLPAVPPEGGGTDALLEGGGRVPRSEPDPKWTAVFTVSSGVGGLDQVDVTCALYTRTQIRQLRYENQVAERRDFVRKRSGGRLVYHHVQTMLQADLTEFAAAVPEYQKTAEALVLDIRDGVGGNIHHAMAQALDSTSRERLDGRPACYIRGRGRESQADGIRSPYMRRFQGTPWNRPSICLMNNICRSDKEIFPHLYRHLGLGTLVGEPSAHGVIGSTYVSLPDGGQCMISSSVFFTADGESMEGGLGVVPDVIVNETVADLYAGRDRQLETAVDTLLAQLDGKLPFPEKLKAADLAPLDKPVVPRRLLAPRDEPSHD